VDLISHTEQNTLEIKLNSCLNPE